VPTPAHNKWHFCVVWCQQFQSLDIWKRYIWIYIELYSFIMLYIRYILQICSDKIKLYLQVVCKVVHTCMCVRGWLCTILAKMLCFKDHGGVKIELNSLDHRPWLNWVDCPWRSSRWFWSVFLFHWYKLPRRQIRGLPTAAEIMCQRAWLGYDDNSRLSAAPRVLMLHWFYAIVQGNSCLNWLYSKKNMRGTVLLHDLDSKIIRCLLF
jgi:hypothetical protein